MSRKAGGPLAMMKARANASTTTGFIAVSLAAARSTAGAPARPLLKCSEMPQWRLAAKRASTSEGCWLSSSKDAGNHAE